MRWSARRSSLSLLRMTSLQKENTQTLSDLHVHYCCWSPRSFLWQTINRHGVWLATSMLYAFGYSEDKNDDSAVTWVTRRTITYIDCARKTNKQTNKQKSKQRGVIGRYGMWPRCKLPKATLVIHAMFCDSSWCWRWLCSEHVHYTLVHLTIERTTKQTKKTTNTLA